MIIALISAKKIRGYTHHERYALYDADGSGGGASVPIAIVGGGLAMTHSDIVVI